MAIIKRLRTPQKSGFSSPFDESLSDKEIQLFRELQEESIRLDGKIESVDVEVQEFDDSKIIIDIDNLRRDVLRYTQNYERLGFRP